jgi:hypothetical protein
MTVDAIAPVTPTQTTTSVIPPSTSNQPTLPAAPPPPVLPTTGQQAVAVADEHEGWMLIAKAEQDAKSRLEALEGRLAAAEAWIKEEEPFAKVRRELAVRHKH